MEEHAGYRNLLVWQKADALIIEIYTSTRLFPKDEMYGLTSQIRRAALSVPTNIVEGYARNGKSEFKRFITISLGSLAEVKYLLSVATRLHYLSEVEYKKLICLAESVGQLLWRFYKSL